MKSGINIRNLAKEQFVPTRGVYILVNIAFLIGLYEYGVMALPASWWLAGVMHVNVISSRW